MFPKSGDRIIARGERPETESKLKHAGANRVILPTHIGAERIAEMILYPETARFLRASERTQEMERALRGLGLELQVIVAPERGACTGLTIEQIETRGRGSFFVVQLNRRGGDTVNAPEPDLKVHGGDGVVVVGRGGQAVRALFEAPPEKLQAGRLTF